jgi:hypothetical protein
MRLSYSGREHLDVTTTDSTGGTLDVTFDNGTTWHPMEAVDPTHARVLVAGPGATDNPAGTVVLQPGRYPISVRLTRGVESIIRDVDDELLEVLTQSGAARLSAAICYPESTDWSCAPAGFSAGLDADTRARVEALAWRSLQALLGYSLSICPVIVRPCAARVGLGVWREGSVSGMGTFAPYVAAGGEWRNGCGCTAASACECTSAWEVRLEGPIGRVVSVTVDGVPLPSDAYLVRDGDRLVRVDGDVWPLTQDLRADIDAENTFAVTYFRGSAPSALDDWAAGLLAYEFARACAGDRQCRLPSGVTNVVRQGVTMEIRQGLFADGTTGIRELDAYVESVNPHRLKAPPSIMSPDTLRRRPRMQTWGR